MVFGIGKGNKENAQLCEALAAAQQDATKAQQDATKAQQDATEKINQMTQATQEAEAQFHNEVASIQEDSNQRVV